MIFCGVQPVTYGNIQTCDAGVDGRRHGDGDGTVYANILPSATSPGAESQYRDNEDSQRVVYSELWPTNNLRGWINPLLTGNRVDNVGISPRHSTGETTPRAIKSVRFSFATALSTVNGVLAERYYVTFGLCHEPFVCRPSVVCL